MMTLLDAPSIKVIFFDLGFTLINYEGDFYQGINNSYAALAGSLVNLGIPIKIDAFTRKFDQIISEYYRTREIDLIERPVERYLDQTLAFFGYENVSEETIQSALTEMYKETEAQWQIEPDAIRTLEILKEQGYRLGLITNAANSPDSNRLIDKFNLRRFFDAILISADEKIRKPDTRIYSRALKRMNVKPDEAVMVGDTLTADILGAQNSGMYGIWIKRRADRPENRNLKADITPDAVIETLDELPDAIRSLN